MRQFFKSRFMLVRYVGHDIQALPLPMWSILTLGLVIPALIMLAAAFAAYELHRDDILSAILDRHVASDYAYEARLVTYRTQLDRLASHQLVDQNTLEGRVRDLMARQMVLENRSNILASLADQVSLPPDVAAITGKTQPPVPVRTSATPLRPTFSKDSAKPAETSDNGDKTRPAKDLRVEAPARPEPWMQAQTTLDKPIGDTVNDLSSTYAEIETHQNETVGVIANRARSTSTVLKTALNDAGLGSARFMPAAKNNSKDAPMGGPLLELATDPTGSPFERTLHAMRGDILSAQYLLANLPTIPLRRPIFGALDTTSGFGSRIDPFTGRYAMHTGLDFRDAMGAPVRATAAGKVVFAGPNGGYGNMVEVDHGNGLTTRYAHLSAISVRENQLLNAGATLGRLGSTGRSTGPHLHYEVRVDGDAVDPSRLLRAGTRLFEG